MKKFVLLFAVVVLSFTALHAGASSYQEYSSENGLVKASWSPFQLAFVPEKYWMLISGNADIYGLALGIFYMEQYSTTCSIAVTSGQYKNYGLQCGAVTMTDLNYGLSVCPMINFVERNYGVQVSVVNVKFDDQEKHRNLEKTPKGVQIGVFNYGEGFQLGVLNYNPKARISIFPIINFPK